MNFGFLSFWPSALPNISSTNLLFFYNSNYYNSNFFSFPPPPIVVSVHPLLTTSHKRNRKIIMMVQSSRWHVDESTTTTNTTTTVGGMDRRVSDELELLRHIPIDDDGTNDGERFPKACKNLLRQIPGNLHCVDCGKRNPDWASITYGALLCVRCSGIHRSYGVEVSRVRSITMDHWSYTQILSMLEGGNEQLQEFFVRHNLSSSSSKTTTNSASINDSSRYQTKAAKFYRTNLGTHVTKISKSGCYKGRQTSSRKKMVFDEETTTTTTTTTAQNFSNNNKNEDKTTTVCPTSNATTTSTTNTHQSSKRRSSIHKEQQQRQKQPRQPLKQQQQQQQQQQQKCSKTLPARQSSNTCYHSLFGLFVR